MNWLIENWYLLIGGAAVLALAIYCVSVFFKMPTNKQAAKVKEWLIFACIEAEKELQSGTGQLKLRQVYNMFCSVPAFTWVAKIISFELFSKWVSDALVTVKEMLVNNSTLAAYVYGDNSLEEVEKLKLQLESN